METYKIPLVPGPVSVPEALRAVYRIDYGSADLEEEFFGLYAECERKLQVVLGTQNQVTIQSGEGMLALWAALKSVIRPGDRVLAVATGLFGYGIGEMAKQIGAVVEVVGFDYDQAIDFRACSRGSPSLPAAPGDGRALRDPERRAQPACVKWEKSAGRWVPSST